MSFGFRTLDESGNELFSTEKRIIRVMHVEFVLASSPRRVVDVPNLRADRAYWISQPTTPHTRGPVATLFDGYIEVQGGANAGTSNSTNGYITIIGFG